MYIQQSSLFAQQPFLPQTLKVLYLHGQVNNAGYTYTKDVTYTRRETWLDNRSADHDKFEIYIARGLMNNAMVHLAF
jgi:hypothetical protein